MAKQRLIKCYLNQKKTQKKKGKKSSKETNKNIQRRNIQGYIEKSVAPCLMLCSPKLLCEVLSLWLTNFAGGSLSLNFCTSDWRWITIVIIIVSWSLTVSNLERNLVPTIAKASSTLASLLLASGSSRSVKGEVESL